MGETLNQEEQQAFVQDIIANVLRRDVIVKYNLSNNAYDYYRQKLNPLIDKSKLMAELKIKADFHLAENTRLLKKVWKNLEELIQFKKTVCDRVLYDKVVREIENLSILYSEAIAYDKPIIVPPRLKELDEL